MNTNSKENTGYQINCSHTSPSNLARNEKQKTTNPLIHNILIPAAPSAHPKPSPTGGIEKNKKRKHMKCCLGDITCPLPARFCLRSSPKNPVQTPYEMSSYTSEHYLPSLLLLALTFLWALRPFSSSVICIQRMRCMSVHRTDTCRCRTVPTRTLEQMAVVLHVLG